MLYGHPTEDPLHASASSSVDHRDDIHKYYDHHRNQRPPQPHQNNSEGSFDSRGRRQGRDRMIARSSSSASLRGSWWGGWRRGENKAGSVKSMDATISGPSSEPIPNTSESTIAAEPVAEADLLMQNLEDAAREASDRFRSGKVTLEDVDLSRIELLQQIAQQLSNATDTSLAPTDEDDVRSIDTAFTTTGRNPFGSPFENNATPLPAPSYAYPPLETSSRQSIWEDATNAREQEFTNPQVASAAESPTRPYISRSQRATNSSVCACRRDRSMSRDRGIPLPGTQSPNPPLLSTYALATLPPELTQRPDSPDSVMSASSQVKVSRDLIVPKSIRIKDRLIQYLSDFYSASSRRQSEAIRNNYHPDNACYTTPFLNVAGGPEEIEKVAQLLPAICRNVEVVIGEVTETRERTPGKGHTVIVEATITLHFKHLLIWRLLQLTFGDTYTFRAHHYLHADSDGRLTKHEEVISLRDAIAALPVVGLVVHFSRPLFVRFVVGGWVSRKFVQWLDEEVKSQTGGPTARAKSSRSDTVDQAMLRGLIAAAGKDRGREWALDDNDITRKDKDQDLQNWIAKTARTTEVRDAQPKAAMRSGTAAKHLLDHLPPRPTRPAGTSASTSSPEKSSAVRPQLPPLDHASHSDIPHRPASPKPSISSVSSVHSFATARTSLPKQPLALTHRASTNSIPVTRSSRYMPPPVEIVKGRGGSGWAWVSGWFS
ncbi:hypothetical protein DFS34DRAFT_621551 [Phlyctochytrium arcticum]|nr:hypothetical protein DFS34DRAFT_621551 [Phlyctochytrium arcticum]